MFIKFFFPLHTGISIRTTQIRMNTGLI